MPKHSPAMFWLLVAATLAVDAVAITWLSQADEWSIATHFYDALLSGELAVVCLWGVFAARRALWGWIAAIVAVLIAAQATKWLTGLSYAEACGIYGGYVAMLAAALWILRRTTFWRRLTGAAPVVWQYSMGHLLAVMTLIAVLIGSLRSSELLLDAPEAWRFFTMLTVGDVIISAVTTLLWALDRHWILRLAMASGVAVLVGGIEMASLVSGLLGRDAAATWQGQPPMQFVAYAITMSLVIFVWLELVPIVPRSRPSSLADEEQRGILPKQ